MIETITVPKRVLEKVELGTEREGELQGKELDNVIFLISNIRSKWHNSRMIRSFYHYI